jgi:hypothetical protein
MDFNMVRGLIVWSQHFGKFLRGNIKHPQGIFMPQSGKPGGDLLQGHPPRVGTEPPGFREFLFGKGRFGKGLRSRSIRVPFSGPLLPGSGQAGKLRVLCPPGDDQQKEE